MTYGKTGGCFENILVEQAGGELLWKWRPSDADSVQAVKLVIERWVNDTEASDDVILRPCAHQGQAQVEDETLLNLIYDKRFASLMRVARTDLKPLLWNRAFDWTSSTSAR